MPGHGFDWFSGVASMATPCPPALREKGALERFYAGPNAPEWGVELPRILIHESLHAWQLAGSRWLQQLVDDEWRRASLLRVGQPPPAPGARRQAYGRSDAGEPFAVRDLLECLARFWDVHIRGPRSLLAEEGDDLGGLMAEIDRRRLVAGHGGYASVEFEALMTAGREHGAYAAPYRWLLEQAANADTVRALARGGGLGHDAASWAANVVLPIAGFVALNADEPVPAFRAAVARLLAADAIGIAATQRHPRFRSINIDWLICWPVLTPGVERVLRRDGHRVARAHDAPAGSALAAHPVWQHLPARLAALRKSTWRVVSAAVQTPDSTPEGAALQLEARVYPADPAAMLALPGQPSARCLLGAALAPPWLQFADGDLPGDGTSNDNEACALRAAVAHARSLSDALRRADAATRRGLRADAFEAAPA